MGSKKTLKNYTNNFFINSINFSIILKYKFFCQIPCILKWGGRKVLSRSQGQDLWIIRSYCWRDYTFWCQITVQLCWHNAGTFRPVAWLTSIGQEAAMSVAVETESASIILASLKPSLSQSKLTGQKVITGAIIVWLLWVSHLISDWIWNSYH